MGKNKISSSFNLILFIYICFAAFVSIQFEPETESKAPWDKLYDKYPLLSLGVAILFGAILLLWGAKLLQIIWNRLLADVFKVREIEYQEALSIALFLEILTFT